MPTDKVLENADEVETRVRRIIAKCQRVPIETVTSDKTFADLGIDSLSSITIAFDLESEFNIDIPEDALESIQSVHGAIEGVERLLQKKSSQG